MASDIEFKLRAIEELEFELIVATKTDNQDIVAGLERAIEILEGIE